MTKGSKHPLDSHAKEIKENQGVSQLDI